MPPRKRAAATKAVNPKKPPKRPSNTSAISRAIPIIETKVVPIDDLQMHHKNPRIGNVEAIAESLRENGQFKAILVNVGTQTGRANEILAGNHTWLGMKSLGEEHIYASFVDVSEEEGVKILLADNKIGQLGSFDEKIIGDLFKGLPDVSGTGFNQDEVDKLLDAQASLDEINATYDADTQSLIDGVVGNSEDDEDGGERRSPRERYKEDRVSEDDAVGDRSTRIEGANDDEDVDDPDLVADEPVDKMAELQVVLELKEDNVYKNPNNFYGIPEIPEHAILEEFPKDIRTWIGHEYTEDAPGRHFLYNYSLGGTKGLDFSRTILAFNTYDYKFQSWWDTPAYNLSRLMVKGLKIAVVPDFSYYYTECRIHHLWGVYRANWLGRFFAEAGLKVVPRVQWDFRDPEYLQTALQGVPLNTPTLECSIQNINDEADRKVAAKQLRAILEEIKPEEFMVYGGNPAMRLVKESGYKGNVLHVQSYSNARRESGAFDRKEGVKGISAKQKKALREKYGAKEKVLRENGEDEDETNTDEE